ncbi:hypothetical protein CHARACLAT_008979 [Characodon lateralis]|uniref:Nucleolar transcription factor 1 n=1 Tax=Characodon lateralis TaxID=208331 RepID=A0ABU7ES52_9TELE|nr:hypothetical protein [Characodon lateralis]
MSEIKMDDVESDAEATQWTRENLEKLLASMKDSIPKKEQTQTYIRGLRALEWDKVAFPPFSPEECRVKWNSMMGKMRRFRSLPELLDEAEHVVSDPVHHRNIPKRPAPPKLAYMAKNMSRYKKKHPGLTMAQVAKKLAKKYDRLPEEKKMNCVRKYTIELDEYSRRKQDFCIDNNLTIPRKSGSKRSAPKDGSDFPLLLALGGEGCSKDEGLPEKPPPHGRALFLKEQSKAGRSSFGGGFFKDMGQRWKEMSKNKKQMYNTRCEKMKREYETKLIECLDRLDEEEKQRIIKEKGIKFPKKTLDRYVRLPGEPKLPPRSGFIYFFIEHSKDFSGTRKDHMTQVKKHWYKLSAKEKNRYAEKSQEKNRKYQEDLQKWFQTLTPEEQEDYLRKKSSKVKFLQKYVHDKKKVPKQPSDSEDESSLPSGVKKDATL